MEGYTLLLPSNLTACLMAFEQLSNLINGPWMFSLLWMCLWCSCRRQFVCNQTTERRAQPSESHSKHSWENVFEENCYNKHRQQTKGIYFHKSEAWINKNTCAVPVVILLPIGHEGHKHVRDPTVKQYFNSTLAYCLHLICPVTGYCTTIYGQKYVDTPARRSTDI